MKLIQITKKALSKLSILPSWVILCIDTIILFTTNLISYLFLYRLGVVFYENYTLTTQFTIIIGTTLFYLIVFKTYKGIIRYTTINDIGRFFKAIFASFCTLILIDLINVYFTGLHIFISYSLFYSGFFVFFTLTGYRVLIKYTFQYLSKELRFSDKETIAIIGVNPQNISLVDALNSPQSAFNLVCFLDPNVSLNDKKVAGINIVSYSSKPIIFYIRWKGIKNIVLTKDYLSEEVEQTLIENCINNNIKVFKPELITNSSDGLENLKTYNLEELLFRETIEIKNTNLIEQFKNKTILVTGGAGSIGSELGKQLAMFNPKKLVILDHGETPLHYCELYFSKNFPDCNCSFELVDVSNLTEFETVFKKHHPEIIFHAAAYKHVPILEKNYKQAIKVNVFGTKNCLDLAHKYGAKKFIFISTDKAVNPTNIMGASKRFAEMIAQSSYQSTEDPKIMQIITTRFGNVLGSNGSVVHLFQEQIKAGGPITVTHPEVNRFFMTIPEACKLVIEAGAMGTGGKTYIFDMGKSIKIVDLAKKMIRLAGKVPNKDIEIVFTGLRTGEKIYEEVLTQSAETLPTYHPKIVIAIEKNPTNELIHEVFTQLENVYQLDRKEVIDQLKRIVPGFTPYE
jgi:FlaA1/EpsC-like NDP-sugar epimerase